MAAQTIVKTLGGSVNITNFSCKDAQGNPCTGLTSVLNIVSGDPAGLQLHLQGGVPTGVPQFISTLKAGTYTVTITSTNAQGPITSDAAGDTDGTADTIVVQSGAPASQTWEYQ